MTNTPKDTYDSQNQQKITNYSDNSSLVITSHKLDGKNFLQWSQSVLMVIRGRGKMGYLTGKIPQPSPSDPLYSSW